MQKRCYNVVRLAGIPATRQRQPDNLLPVIAAIVARHNSSRIHRSCTGVKASFKVGLKWG